VLIGPVRLGYPTKEIPMKTPYAILIGLALIAAAIFYREPSVSAAQAGGIKVKYMDGFKCVARVPGGLVNVSSGKYKLDAACFVLHGNRVTALRFSNIHGWFGDSNEGNSETKAIRTTKWR